jgi:hypothetical protein
MNKYQAHLLRMYHFILHLYPTGYQEGFADEMLHVFQMQLEDLPNLRLWHALKILWSEVYYLPALLASAYLRERIKPMKTNLERYFIQPQGSGKEILLAILPFLLMGLLPGLFSLVPAARDLPVIIGMPILILLALILILVGIAGLIVQLPRWSLVYAGILLTLLSLGSIFLLNLFGSLLPMPETWSILLKNSILLSLHLVLLFALVAGMIWIGERIPLTRKFSQDLRSDPLLISFMLYGGAFLIVLFNFEDVTGADIYLILTSLVMALGAGIFLQSKKTTNQLVGMLCAVTLASAFSLVANLTLVNYNAPPMDFLVFTLPAPSLFVGLSWLVAIVMIILPLWIFRSSSSDMVRQA